MSDELPTSELKKILLNLHKMKQDVKVPRSAGVNKESHPDENTRKDQDRALVKDQKMALSSAGFKPQTGSRADHHKKKTENFLSPNHFPIKDSKTDFIPDMALALVKSTSEQLQIKVTRPINQASNVLKDVGKTNSDA